MLTIEEKTVYDILVELAGDTEVYKIIEAEEVLEKIPTGLTLTKIQLSQIIRDLKDREYVDVKYFTPDEYCLQITRRIETPVAGQAQPQKAEDGKQERVLYGEKKSKEAAPKASVKKGIVFLMAFLGAFLGSAVVAAAAMLIIKFVL